MTLSCHDSNFNVTALFDAQYLTNGTRYRHSYSGILIDTSFWRLVQCWYSRGRHVTIGIPTVIFAVLTVFWLFLKIGTLLVYCWYSRGRPVTIGTPMVLTVFGTVYQSSKTVKNNQKQPKDSQNSNNDHWSWLVYQSSHVNTETAEYTKSASASAILVRVRVRRIHKAPKSPSHHLSASTCCGRTVTAWITWRTLDDCLILWCVTVTAGVSTNFRLNQNFCSSFAF